MAKKIIFLPLLGALLAGAVWYLLPEAGAWPLLLVGGAFAGHLGQKWSVQGSSADLFMAIFLLTAYLSARFAPDQGAAWGQFWVIVGGVALFYGMMMAREREDVLAEGLVYLGAAISLYFIATHDWDAFPAKVVVITKIGRLLQTPFPTLPTHTLHPNVVGGLLGVCLPFAFTPPYRPIKLILSGLVFLGLLLSQSRGAWLAIGVVAGLRLLWLILGKIEATKRLRLVSGVVVLGLMIWVGVAVFRPNQLASIAGGAGRVQLWQESAVLAQDYPFVGAGLDNFMMVHASYSLLTHVGYIVHGHNLYLDVAVMQGMATALLLVGFWLVTLFGQKGCSAVQLAAMGSWATIALHGLVEDAFYGSRAVLLLFVPLAFLVKRLPFGRSYLLHNLPVLMIVLGWVVWQGPSGWWANWGAVQQGRVELSVYRWPEYGIQDAVRREKSAELQTVLEAYRTALQHHPDHGSANRRLGQMELSLGDYEQALHHLQQIKDQQPNVVRQLLGEAYLVNGERETGKRLWRGINQQQGQGQVRAYWYESLGDEVRRQAIEEGIGR